MTELAQNDPPVAASAEQVDAARWWTHERMGVALLLIAIVVAYHHDLRLLVDALGQILRAA